VFVCLTRSFFLAGKVPIFNTSILGVVTSRIAAPYYQKKKKLDLLNSEQLPETKLRTNSWILALQPP